MNYKKSLDKKSTNNNIQNQSENSQSKILDIVGPEVFQTEQEVQLIVVAQTDLGFKCIVNNAYWGVLYSSEVFQYLKPQQEIKGYIKKIRPDGKIDLTLYKEGSKGSEDISEKICKLLMQENGFLPITDKTDPKEIYELFGVSKKKFKMAIGGLYKRRVIKVMENGIYLNKESIKS